MTEVLELRIPEERAREFLHPSEGVTIRDTVRKVTLNLNDDRIGQIREINSQFEAQGNHFFLGWSITRKYTAEELASAVVFQFLIPRVFEPSGEECGTKYDESPACAACGAGRIQASDLFLRRRSLPTNSDFAQTIAGDEWIISARAARIFQEEEVTGVKLGRILDSSGRIIDDWYQLNSSGERVDIAKSTRTGIHPFDDDEADRYRCPECDVIGLNILSEVHVKAESWTGFDLSITRQLVGVRSGLLVPRPLIVISSRLRRLIGDQNLRGYGVEIARLV